MKILRHGTKQEEQPKRFKCWKCGCEFEAESTEYKIADAYAQQHDNIEAECKCPECGFIAYC